MVIELSRIAAGSRFDWYYIPTAYKKMKNKIKNKNVKAVLDTGIDDYVPNKGIELIGESFK